MVALAIFTALLFGMFAGFLLGIRPAAKPQGFHATPDRLDKTILKHWFRPMQKQAATPTAIGSIPRSALGWRRQRNDLQKAHNSQQKQRDSGLPAL